MLKQSMANVAYEILCKKGKEMSFTKLWKEVVKKLDLSSAEAEENISLFYTELTLDGRVANVGNNVWNLRSKVSYDKIKVDLKDAYDDDLETEKEEKAESNKEDEDGSEDLDNENSEDLEDSEEDDDDKDQEADY